MKMAPDRGLFPVSILLLRLVVIPLSLLSSTVFPVSVVTAFRLSESHNTRRDARREEDPPTQLSIFPEPRADASIAVEIFQKQALKIEKHKLLIKVAEDAAKTLERVTVLKGKLDAAKEKAASLHHENLALMEEASREADAAEAVASEIDKLEFGESVGIGMGRAVEEVRVFFGG